MLDILGYYSNWNNFKD